MIKQMSKGRLPGFMGGGRMRGMGHGKKRR